MQDPEHIRRFTHGMAMMTDPPFLPFAVYLAVVPLLVQFGVLAGPWLFYLSVVAAAATALGSRRFKRTYGVVIASPASFPGWWRWLGVGRGFWLVVGVLGLEMLSSARHVPVRLGMVLFGAWLAAGARASAGMRTHLYVLAAICVGMALVPLVVSLAGHRVLQDAAWGAIFTSAFGLGWIYVCIQDYRAIRRHLPTVQG